MTPTLTDGDTLLVRYGVQPRPGEVAVARFPDGTLTVKRVESTRPTSSGDAGWWLVSDNSDEGIDSRHRGVFAAEAVLGVVRVRLWPRPRRLRR
jgi:phage repressor protein C with HTH and peptisase S24 domain